jgi:hypothetical protein
MSADVQPTSGTLFGQPAGRTRVVAFLQNQWVQDPERVRAIYARYAGDLERRAELNARFLFLRSVTGRRLREAFGELCDRIVWEEITTEIGGVSGAVFPADPGHVRRVLAHFDPAVVLAFGRVARDGLIPFIGRRVMVFAPHPAARRPSVFAELRAAAERLRDVLAVAEGTTHVG